MSVSPFDCLFCLKKTSSLKNKLAANVLQDLDLFKFFCNRLLQKNNEIHFSFDSINERMLPVCTKCANLYKQLAELYAEFKELETQIKSVVEEFRQFVFISEKEESDKKGIKNNSDFHRTFRQCVLQRANNEEINIGEMNIKEELIDESADQSEIEETNIMAMTIDHKIELVEENFDDFGDFEENDNKMDQEEEISGLKNEKVEIETCAIEPRRSSRNRQIRPTIKKAKTIRAKKPVKAKAKSKSIGVTSTSSSTKDFESISTKKRTKKEEKSQKTKKVIKTKDDVPKKLICPLSNCEKELENISQLSRHVRKHEFTTLEKDKTLSCSFCQKIFAVERNLKHHLYLHNLDKDKEKEAFICQQCDIRCKSQETLDKHMTEMHQRNMVKFMCPICGSQFKSKSGFNLHIKAHNGVKRNQKSRCKYCPEEFSQYVHLKRHELEKHLDSAQIYSCTFCGKNLLTNSFLQIHLKKHSGENPYGCRICGEKFKSRSGLDTHTIKEHGKKEYSCALCGDKKFVSRNGFQRHKRIHHGQGKTPFHYCTICEKKFHSKSTLDNHFLSHGEARNFMCEQCGKSFKSPDTLKKHRYLHSEEGKERYKCDICHKGFGWFTSKKVHMKAHHEIDISRKAKAIAPNSTANSATTLATNSVIDYSINYPVGANLPSELLMMYSNSYPFQNL